MAICMLSRERYDQATEFAERAIHLFDEMGARPETQVAKKVLGWLERNAVKDFSQRDVFQAVKGGIVVSVDDLAAGLSVLEQHGYIRPEQSAARSGPGKPPDAVERSQNAVEPAQWSAPG